MANKGGQLLVAVPHTEEVGLSLQTVFLAHSPLFQVHLAAGSGEKSNTRSRCDDGEDRGQRDGVGTHSVPASVLSRAASTRYAAHMHNVLSTIQEISQKRLKGIPRTMGS